MLRYFPFPNYLDPDSIYRNKKSSLEKMGYRGALSIKAYIDKEKFTVRLVGVYSDAVIEIIIPRMNLNLQEFIVC